MTDDANKERKSMTDDANKERESQMISSSKKVRTNTVVRGKFTLCSPTTLIVKKSMSSTKKTTDLSTGPIERKKSDTNRCLQGVLAAKQNLQNRSKNEADIKSNDSMPGIETRTVLMNETSELVKENEQVQTEEKGKTAQSDMVSKDIDKQTTNCTVNNKDIGTCLTALNSPCTDYQPNHSLIYRPVYLNDTANNNQHKEAEKKHNQTEDVLTTSAEIKGTQSVDKLQDTNNNASEIFSTLFQDERVDNLSQSTTHNRYLQAKKDLHQEETEHEANSVVFPLSYPGTVRLPFQMKEAGEYIDKVKPGCYSPTIEDFEIYRQTLVKRLSETDSGFDSARYTCKVASGSATLAKSPEGLSVVKNCMENRIYKCIAGTGNRHEATFEHDLPAIPQDCQMDTYSKENGSNIETAMYMATPIREDSCQALTDGGNRVCSTGTHVNDYSELYLNGNQGDGRLLEDIVSGILAEDNLISDFSTKKQNSSRQVGFPEDLSDIMVSTAFVDCMSNLPEELPFHEQNFDGKEPTKDDNNEMESSVFKSVRTPFTRSKNRKHKFQKRLPASFPKAKSQKVLSIEKQLCEAAERFLGDFNDKDKRSCREKSEIQKNLPQTSTGHEIKNSVNRSRESSVDSNAPKSDRQAEKVASKVVAEKSCKKLVEEKPDKEVTGSQSATHKVLKLSNESISLEDVKPCKMKILQQSRAIKDNPRIPSLKLKSVKKGKQHWPKKWSINKERVAQLYKEKRDKHSKEVKHAQKKPKQSKYLDKKSLGHTVVSDKKDKENNEAVDKRGSSIIASGSNKDKQSDDFLSRPAVEVMTCKICKFKTTSRDQMEFHYRRFHKEWCYKCAKKFLSVVC